MSFRPLRISSSNIEITFLASAARSSSGSFCSSASFSSAAFLAISCSSSNLLLFTVSAFESLLSSSNSAMRSCARLLASSHVFFSSALRPSKDFFSASISSLSPFSFLLSPFSFSHTSLSFSIPSWVFLVFAPMASLSPFFSVSNFSTSFIRLSLSLALPILRLSMSSSFLFFSFSFSSDFLFSASQACSFCYASYFSPSTSSFFPLSNLSIPLANFANASLRSFYSPYALFRVFSPLLFAFSVARANSTLGHMLPKYGCDWLVGRFQGGPSLAEEMHLFNHQPW